MLMWAFLFTKNCEKINVGLITYPAEIKNYL